MIKAAGRGEWSEKKEVNIVVGHGRRGVGIAVCFIVSVLDTYPRG